METIKGIFNENINEKEIFEAVLSKVENTKGKRYAFKYAIVPICIVILCSMVFLKDVVVPSEKDDIVVINEVGESKDVAMRLDVDVRRTDCVDVIGFVDIMEIEIPADMTQNKIFEVYGRSEKTGEYDKLAWYNYYYCNPEGDRWIDLNFSDTAKPARCYIFEGGKTSRIGENEMRIYHYENSYIAEFEYNGFYYDIETGGITEEELMNMLTSIVR